MPAQRIEPVAAGFTITYGAITFLADVMRFLSNNAAAISVLVVIGGFVIQFLSSRRNAKKQAAEEKRAQEEHEIKMKILRGELPDRRTGVDLVEAVEK